MSDKWVDLVGQTLDTNGLKDPNEVFSWFIDHMVSALTDIDEAVYKMDHALIKRRTLEYNKLKALIPRAGSLTPDITWARVIIMFVKENRYDFKYAKVGMRMNLYPILMDARGRLLDHELLPEIDDTLSILTERLLEGGRKMIEKTRAWYENAPDIYSEHVDNTIVMFTEAMDPIVTLRELIIKWNIMKGGTIALEMDIMDITQLYYKRMHYLLPQSTNAMPMYMLPNLRYSWCDDYRFMTNDMTKDLLDLKDMVIARNGLHAAQALLNP